MLFDIGGGEEQCWRVTFDQVARVEEFLGRVFGEMEKLRKSEKVRGGSTLVGRKGRKEAGAGRCRQWQLPSWWPIRYFSLTAAAELWNGK